MCLASPLLNGREDRAFGSDEIGEMHEAVLEVGKAAKAKEIAEREAAEQRRKRAMPSVTSRRLNARSAPAIRARRP